MKTQIMSLSKYDNVKHFLLHEYSLCPLPPSMQTDVFSGPSSYYLPCTYLLDDNLSGRLRYQLYKWVPPVDLLLGITLRYTSIISKGNNEYSPALFAT